MDRAVARILDYARAERGRRIPDAGGVQIAREYHGGLAHVEQFRNGLLPRLRGCGDPRGCRVLEVGAGMGYMAALLASTEVERVIATDPDWREVTPRTPLFLGPYRAIHEHWKLDGVVSFRDGRQEFHSERLAFVRADGLRLPFDDASFDVAFSHGSLEHFPDMEGVFREMLRVLKPGGLLYGESEKFWAAHDGSHFHEVFPAPWLHLLLTPERMWEHYEALSGGKDLLWPGRYLDREFFIHMLTRDLNRRGVRPIKRMILDSRCDYVSVSPRSSEESELLLSDLDPRMIVNTGCDLVFWMQRSSEQSRRLLKELGIRSALRDWPLEELLTDQVAFGVRKRPGRFRTRLVLRLPWRLKRMFPESLKRAFRNRLPLVTGR